MLLEHMLLGRLLPTTWLDKVSRTGHAREVGLFIHAGGSV